MALFLTTGCLKPAEYRQQADDVAYDIIEQKQRQAFGETESFSIQRPSDTLRNRLLIEQGLPIAGPEAFGVEAIEPVEHWPDELYRSLGADLSDELLPVNGENPIVLSLNDALRIAAANSRTYQAQKESVFSSALALDLERDEFRSTFASLWTSRVELQADSGDGTSQTGLENGVSFGVDQRFKNGVDLTTAIALDLAQIVGSGASSGRAISFDASVSIPLLRGAGEHIVTEPLIQAERNALYAILNFERFKRTFAVDIATDYLSVVQQLDVVRVQAENYRSLILESQRARDLAREGRLSPIQVDQAIQDELSARDSWIGATRSYLRSLDLFKVRIGLPPDAHVILMPEALQLLADSVRDRIPRGSLEAETDPDGQIILPPPTDEGAGPLELPAEQAIRLALANRLDLRVALGAVYDAQRDVVVAADNLRAELTLLGRANVGGGTSIGSTGAPNTDLRFDEGVYDALLTLDLPLERTAERNAYRLSLIGLEDALRDLQELEDSIKIDIRDELRTLEQSRESLRIQALSVQLAEQRVDSTRQFLELNRDNIQIRDVLEAQEDLVDARNGLSNALVDYRVAELQLQSDTGILEVDETGIWAPFDPERLEQMLNEIAADDALTDPNS